ncbi:MAG: hypothetical protein IKC71_03620 [Clostridia bacterium]|nr:hypothetical protein [Clostridia bacterium]
MVKDLVAYQEVDAKLREIEVFLSNSEERKKSVVARRFLETVDESVQKLDKRAEELGIMFKNVDASSEKLKEEQVEFLGALEEVETPEEAIYLKKKLDELLSKMNALEKETANLKKEMEDLSNEYLNLRKKTKAAQNQYTENFAKFKELRDAKQPEVDALKKELEELGKKVDIVLFEKYQQKRKDKSFPIVYKVVGETCPACSMSLSMIDLNNLDKGDVIECEACRKLLYKE